MQVDVEDLSSVKKMLRIEIPENDVRRELDSAYEDLGKTAKVKGFRPGKVPRAVLEGMYKKQVRTDVSSKLIQNSFSEALRETNLKVLGNPKIDPPELKEKEPYKYEATVEINPEIGDLTIKGLALKKKLYTVGDEEIETQVKLLRQQMSELKPLEEERPVAEEDVVMIDFEGFKDGKPFSETPFTENFPMKIGKGRVAKEFDEQLIGALLGETREINVNFPEDYTNPEMAGKEMMFKATLKEIREEHLPELNDDFAKKYGNENMEALREKVKESLEEGYKKRTDQELSEQIFSAFLAEREFEVPETWVELELDGIIEETERSFANKNISMEEMGLTREMMAGKYRETATKQARRRLLLQKLIEQENLKVSDEEIEKEMQTMADAWGQPVSHIQDHYKQNPSQLDLFKYALLEKQAIKMVIDSSEIEEIDSEAA